MSAPRVLCVGLSCADFLWQVERFPPVGSRTPATGFRRQGGGPAATAAVAVARLGGVAELWALHGDDPAGDDVRAELDGFGVDTARVRRLAGAGTFTSAVLTAPSGERWIFPYRGSGLVDDPAAFPMERVGAFDALLVDFRHPAVCGAALDAARRAGVPSVGDVSNRDAWKRSADLDHLIASEECARDVLGADDPERALDALRHRADQVVGVTLGAEGYLYADGDRIRHVPALPVQVVDTTGAGDVFHGAYAFSVAQGWDVERCAVFAAVAAAVSCTGVGRARIPAADEVEHLLETKTLREMDELRWT